MLKTGPTAKPKIVARFLREVEAAATLSHPNLVEVLDAGERARFAFLAMEVLSGGTLAERLAASGRLSPRRALLRRVVEEMPQPIPEVAPDAGVPARVVALVERCMQKDPAARFETPRDLRGRSRRASPSSRARNPARPRPPPPRLWRMDAPAPPPAPSLASAAQAPRTGFVRRILRALGRRLRPGRGPW